MSRIGKRAISIPAGTDIAVGTSDITVKGKGGTLIRALHPQVKITVDGNSVSVTPVGNSRISRALWGTYAAHIRNMISGVNTPFAKKLEVQGIGYRVELSGTTLKFALGFSHPIVVAVPQGLTATVDKNIITITGADKEQVGQFAASIRELKKPEPYKGKGIRYEGEVVRMKAGKKAGA
jgi:large subunit ribosomal protein L6